MSRDLLEPPLTTDPKTCTHCRAYGEYHRCCDCGAPYRLTESELRKVFDWTDTKAREDLQKKHEEDRAIYINRGRTPEERAKRAYDYAKNNPGMTVTTAHDHAMDAALRLYKEELDRPSREDRIKRASETIEAFWAYAAARDEDLPDEVDRALGTAIVDSLDSLVSKDA